MKHFFTPSLKKAALSAAQVDKIPQLEEPKPQTLAFIRLFARLCPAAVPVTRP